MKAEIFEYLKATKELDIIILKHLTLKQCDEVWFHQAIDKFKNKWPEYSKLLED